MKMKLYNACQRSRGFSAVLPWIMFFLTSLCFFVVSVMWKVTFTSGSVTSLSDEDWRTSECVCCMFSAALRWAEKSEHHKISRKSARDSKGDQTFQMILIDFLMYSNDCCYRRAEPKCYWTCFSWSSIFPRYSGFSKISICFNETWEKLYKEIACSF